MRAHCATRLHRVRDVRATRRHRVVLNVSVPARLSAAVPLDATECTTCVPLGVIECAPKGGRAPLDASRRQRLTMAVPLGRYPAGETKPVSMVM